MFKKGKKWCYMALTTVAVVVGTLMVTQTANADTTVETDSAVASTTSEVLSASANTSSLLTSSENAVSATSSAATTNQTSASSTENTADAMSESANVTSQSVADRDNSQSYVASMVNDNATNAAGTAEIPNSANSITVVEEVLAGSNNSDNASTSSAMSDTENVVMTSLPVAAQKDGLVTENGNTYYYQNGQQLKNYFATINGKTYYFKADGTMAKDYFYNNWGHTYYFQSDGSRMDNNFYNNWGHTYYFGDGGVRLDDGFYNNWGHTYYFGNGGVRLDDGFYNNWGNTYYFGNGGVRLDNSFYNNWGNLYYFGSEGVLQKNRKVTVNLTSYWADNNGVLTPQFDNGVNRYIINNHIGHANITYYNAIPENITGTYSGTDDGKPNMIVVHETANPNDSIWGEINYEKSNYNSAFVHAFVDNNSIIQISNTDHEAWGAAYPANGRAVQFEQVEVYGGWNFAAELVNAAYYTAYKMKQYGMYPRIADGYLGATLWSHHDVSRYLGGTDHTDPDSYWSNRAWTNFGTGYGMWDFTMLVNYEYALLQ